MLGLKHKDMRWPMARPCGGQMVLQLLWLFLFQIGWGQADRDKEQFILQDTLHESGLYDFVQSTDHLKEQINELRRLFLLDHERGDMIQALRKIQWGLILENKLKHPTIEAFEFNVRAGDIVVSMDQRYGLEFYRKATGLLRALPGITASQSFGLYTTRAGIHAHLAEHDSALYYYRKAIHNTKLDLVEGKASGVNNLGVYFFENEMFDSASVYFQQAYTILDGRKEAIGLYCAILDNLAQMDIQEGHLHHALKTFEYNDSVYTARALHHKYIGNKSRQIEVMTRLGQSQIAEEVSKGLRHLRLHRKDVPAKEARTFYRMAIEYYNKTADPEQARKTRQEYYHWADSLDMVTRDQLHALNRSLLEVQQVGFQSELAAHQLAIEKTNLRYQSARRMIVLSMTAGISVTLLLILFFKKRRQELLSQKHIAEAELKHKVMESQIMEHELALRKKDLTHLVLYNTQVYDTNQKMIDRLEAITRSKSDTEPQLRHLLHELQIQNQIGEKSMTIQVEIDSLHHEFYEKLKARFPALTKSEEELCGYLRINLSTKDISILKNIEATSVKMSKNRLRKKLELSPDEDLYDFMLKI